jgi:hypothetical protein
MQVGRVLRASVVVVGVLAAPALAISHAAAGGERFYREGVTPSGNAVEAVVQGDLRLPSTQVPCSNCHRRSRWGGFEGAISVPAVVADVLFQPVTRGRQEMGPLRTTGPGTRPAYTEASLVRAIRDGIDPAGRALSPTMPRYAVGGADAAALVAYLRTPSPPAPGVSADTVHFATVVAANVSAERRAAMLDVLRTFVARKNGGTRAERRRRERGPWDMQQHYSQYRDWRLHEWTLEGLPASWPAQLEAHYAAQPVFALIGGLADSDWTPVHDFGERFGIPVVFPQALLPHLGAAEESFYSLYFSRGVALEADTLAAVVTRSAPAFRLVQLARCGTAGHVAAETLRRALSSNGAPWTECVDRLTALGRDWWQARVEQGNVLVLWLDADDIETLASSQIAPELTRFDHVYLSSTLLGDAAPRLAQALTRKASLLHQFVAPDRFDHHAWRSLLWLKANGIVPSDRRIAVNALFAATLAADALSHPRALDSREYFIERVEHMVERSPTPSAYPALRLGALRRYASTTCDVVPVVPVPAPASP